MTRSVTRQVRRALGVLAFSAVFVSLAASASLAATFQHQTGSIGHAKFKDTTLEPGAECIYDGAAGTQYFYGMTLRKIKVEYPDQNSSAVEHGKVGYKIQLQHMAAGGPWQNYVTSPETKITAYDNAWAKFPQRTQLWNSTATKGKWRAEVILTWYNADNSVKGTGYWTIDHYTRDFNGSVAGTCPGRHYDFPH